MDNFDFAVFETKDGVDKCAGNVAVIDKCPAINRLCHALQYYSLLNINKANHAEKFTHFIKNIYQTLLEDYNHLIQTHGNQIQNINSLLLSKQFKYCKIENCSFTSRHYHTIKTVNNNEELDPVLRFHKDTLDSLHFYLFHLYDTGLRVTEHYATNNDEVKTDDKYFDTALCCLSKTIKEVNINVSSFQRFKVSDKFNIQLHGMQNEKQVGSDTFIDDMINCLVENGVSHQHINWLNALFIEESFDSDTIKYDLKYVDNISAHIQSDHSDLSQLQHFVTAFKNHSNSFNVGFRFYYWEHYKHIIETPCEEQWSTNENDHNGYAICELFVEKKYSSFKEEISNYQHINIEQYELVLVKANSYMQTEIVKSKKVYKQKRRWNKLHYGIAPETSLEIQNLISVIMYTDYSKLSAAFSASFRKKSAFELLISLKERNSHYWWWSKILRETVELYGQCRYRYGGGNSGLSGPFYTGMTCVMVLPAFNIRLCSPTSTSKQMSVALSFSGNNGIVIQLNNKSGANDCLRGFDCSWVSRYKEEDERLFFGGFWRIKVESVMVRPSNKNFGTFIKSMYYLDAMLTGNENIRYLDIKDSEVILIKSLFKWNNGNKKGKNFDRYIYDTFQSFCSQKQQIVIDLDWLKWANEDMVDLILCSLNLGIKERAVKDQSNLLRQETVETFENIKKVVIDTVCSYCISLPALLSLLIKIKVCEKIIIKASSVGGSNWISVVWKHNKKRTKLIQQYKHKNYSIKKEHVNFLSQDWLIIDKLR